MARDPLCNCCMDCADEIERLNDALDLKQRKLESCHDENGRLRAAAQDAGGALVAEMAQQRKADLREIAELTAELDRLHVDLDAFKEWKRDADYRAEKAEAENTRLAGLVYERDTDHQRAEKAEAERDKLRERDVAATARIAGLLTEVERLRAERDRLRLEPTTLELDLLAECTKERDKLRESAEFEFNKNSELIAACIEETVRADTERARAEKAEAERDSLATENARIKSWADTTIEEYGKRLDRLAAVVERVRKHTEACTYEDGCCDMDSEESDKLRAILNSSPATEAPEPCYLRSWPGCGESSECEECEECDETDRAPAPCEACERVRGEAQQTQDRNDRLGVARNDSVLSTEWILRALSDTPDESEER